MVIYLQFYLIGAQSSEAVHDPSQLHIYIIL